MARSLRVRILLGITVPAIAILALSSASLQLWARSEATARLDGSLETRAAAMAALVELEGGSWEVDFDGGSVPAAELFGPLAAYEVHALPDGALLARRALPDAASLPTGLPIPEIRPDLPSDRPLPIAERAETLSLAGRSLRVWSGVYLVRKNDEPPDSQSPRVPGVPLDPDGTLAGVRIVVAQDLAPVDAGLGKLLAVQGLIGLGLSGLALASGRLVSHRIVDPVDAMARIAEGVVGPRAEPPIPLTGSGDEIDRLGRALNASYARLHAAWERQARFTADASHELRTPLSVIRAQAEVALRRDRSAADYREALTGVVSGATRLQDTLDALLVLARADAGALPHPEPVDLRAVAASQVAWVERAAERAHARIRLDAPEAVVVLGDERLLESVARNLLTNAVRHTPPSGGIVVRVHGEGNIAILEVRDDGEGIPADVLPHVFERFYRADSARDRRQGGAGLGLSIVKLVAGLHGGTVTAESTSGRGTTIRVRLPRNAPRAAPAESSAG